MAEVRAVDTVPAMFIWPEDPVILAFLSLEEDGVGSRERSSDLRFLGMIRIRWRMSHSQGMKGGKIARLEGGVRSLGQRGEAGRLEGGSKHMGQQVGLGKATAWMRVSGETELQVEVEFGLQVSNKEAVLARRYAGSCKTVFITEMQSSSADETTMTLDSNASTVLHTAPIAPFQPTTTIVAR